MKEDQPFDQLKKLFLTAVTFKFTGRGQVLADEFRLLATDPDAREKKIKELKATYDGFMRMMKKVFSGEYKKISPVTVGSVGVAALYVLLKKDIISDENVIGWWDDAAVVLWALHLVSKEVERFRFWESAQNINELEIAVV